MLATVRAEQSRRFVLVALMLSLCPVIGLAQGAAKAEKLTESDLLRVRRVLGLGKKGLVKTPYYTSNYGAGEQQPQEWGKIQFEYDTARPKRDEPAYLDGLVFQYYVMTLYREGNDKKYGFMKAKVSYSDVKRGNRHKSAVYLHPKTLERYGYPVAVAVEVLYQGKIISEFTDAEPVAKLPAGRWWKNTRVTENSSVKTCEKQLLSRDQSPFSLVHIDDYEVIR